MTAPEARIAGRYRLVNQVASGGMGSVWEAWDELLHRRVAVKQLLPLAGQTESEAANARSRVIREARITARLHHPHAVTLYDVVEHAGNPCLIMQFVPSRSLHSMLNSGTLPIEVVARIGAQVAAALTAAHQVGIVHRDVKPSNVLMTAEGSAKLTDFGISHAVGDVNLTSTGMVSGTPAYLAPEVARGEPSGFAADVFSLGATLYAALEGTPPFGADQNPMAIWYRVASGQVIAPRRSGPLAPLLLQMLAPDPADRPSMPEVARSLDELQHGAGASPHSRPGVPVVLSAGPVDHRPVPPAIVKPVDPPESAESQPLLGSRQPPPDRRRSYTGLVLAVALSVLLAGAILVGMRVFGGSGSVAAPEAGAAVGISSATSSTTRSPAAVGPAPVGRVIGSSASSPSSSTQPAAPSSSTRPAAPSSAAQSSAASAAAQSPAPSSLRSSARSAAPFAVTSSTLLSSTPLSPTPTSPATTKRVSASVRPAVGESASAAELVDALDGYYALLPGNTDQGWKRLTAGFQSGMARNRQYYQHYWDNVDRVVVSDATASPPNSVQANITYYFADGRVVKELTAYQLVREDGTLKIASQAVQPQ